MQEKVGKISVEIYPPSLACSGAQGGLETGGSTGLSSCNPGAGDLGGSKLKGLLTLIFNGHETRVEKSWLVFDGKVPSREEISGSLGFSESKKGQAKIGSVAMGRQFAGGLSPPSPTPKFPARKFWA